MTARVSSTVLCRLAAVVTAGTLLAACVDEDLNERIAGPGGAANIFNFTLSSSAGSGLPAGSYAVKSPFDAWSRAGRTKIFNSDNAEAIETYSLLGTVRNATNDPRLPALESSTGTIVDTIAGVFLQPRWLGAAGFWDFWVYFSGLKPNTTYTVMMVRYGLQVNGRLDAVDVLSGAPVAAPDSLVVLGGTPQGAPDYLCDFSTTGSPAVSDDANPFVLGYFVTDASGYGLADCLIRVPSDGKWWKASGSAFPAGAADSLPIASNELAPFDLPTYNYFVIVEGRGTAGAPVPTGPHALRLQVGHDLDLNGMPINNALAPFPLGRQVVAEVSLDFSGTSAVQQGKVYRVWAVNSADGSAVPLTGAWQRLDEEGGVVAELALTDTIPGGSGPRDRNTFLVTSDTWPGDVLEYDRIIVTIDDAGATAPSDVIFLEKQFVEGVGNFGTFSGAGALAFPDGFGYTGEGRGYFFGDELRLDISGLRRPPVGYFYEAWLVNAGDGTATSLGALTTPFPAYASLANADTDASLAPSGLIPSAALVVNQRQTGLSFTDYTSVYVTLSPKVRDGLPLQIALPGEIPGQVFEQQ